MSIRRWAGRALIHHRGCIPDVAWERRNMTKNLGRVDYIDRYAVDVPEAMDAPRFCSLILDAAPRWLDLLLSMRDAAAGRLGFNTQERNYGAPVSLVPGRKFGPLVVQSVSSERVVC